MKRVAPSPRLADTIYPARLRPSVDEGLFRRPSAIYRGTPFWAWNSRLQRRDLLRQLKVFRRMGFGGFHIHVRSGLASQYLGKEFMGHVRACVEAGAKLGLRTWLYDEDRWPSGFGGGLVTVDSAHRAKYLLFTRVPYSGVVRPTPNVSCGATGRLENGILLARYAVRLRSGALASYQRLKSGQATPRGHDVWYAYLETVDGTPWFNHRGYVDTLSREATERFIEVTHEQYRAAVGFAFGKEIPAIFTDEPQHLFKDFLDHSDATGDLTMPATSDFFASFQATYSHDLLDTFPEVIWERSRKHASVSRYRYHDHITERFARAYAETLGKWCERHALALTGHLMEEQTLASQTRAVGDAMRSLAHFQLPGIDMLCDRLEITTAKQAQSIAHQYGRGGVMSELYGVTGWNYDFVGHKAQGDWQAAMGVTVRVPHLVWGSMAGEAKRDYPASIFAQSPWWKEYPLIEDHFARINVVMARGSPLVRVAVIHPIESFWLSWGPLAETKEKRDLLERQFQELPEWLLRGLIDFDYLCEALLPEQACVAKEGALQFGLIHYDFIVVPSVCTLRSTTLDLLERFMRAGGRLVFAGEIPRLVDGLLSSRATTLAKKALTCEWSRTALLSSLEPVREFDCVKARGERYEEIFHQWRKDATERHLFLCHRQRHKASGPLTMQLKGTWRVFSRNTMTGKIIEIPAKTGQGRTAFPLEFYAHDHRLLTLREGTSERQPPYSPTRWRTVAKVNAPERITLSEPNVLLLDQAEWRWNDEPWQAREELLRIGNRVRARCQLPPRDGNDAQPWVDSTPLTSLGRVSLRFKILSQTRVLAPELAIEDGARWSLHWNGCPIKGKIRGHWVDQAIHRIALPSFDAGEHELTLVRAYTRKTEIEWCYLLGDFDVAVEGVKKGILAPHRRLQFGNWTGQGLPFYAGNVTYHFTFSLTEPQRMAVRFPKFSAPLLSIDVDGSKIGPVAFAPFRAELGFMKAGSHRLSVTAYGNRHNAFGPLHNRNPHFNWQIPQAWRSTGRQWSYGYKLEPMGLLSAPLIEALSLESLPD